MRLRARNVRRCRASHDVAIVIDLPGASGAMLGVRLVDFGFRPVPLYNALSPSIVMQGVAGLVDVEPIVDVLVEGADTVARARPDACPAFLLDANRAGGDRAPAPGRFDNRSMCWESDFPSPDTLFAHGIRQALVITEAIADDLEPVLLAWQSRGIALWRVTAGGSDPASPFVLVPRAWPHRVLRALRRTWLERRADGAYGRLVLDRSGSGA